MAALIRPDLEDFRRCDTVKTGPVKALVAVMHFTSDSGHESHWVILSFGQGSDGFGEGGIIDGHDVFHLLEVALKGHVEFRGTMKRGFRPVQSR
jgi:hypothetical protein